MRLRPDLCVGGRAAGRHDRPFDSVEYRPPSASDRGNQTYVQATRPLRGCVIWRFARSRIRRAAFGGVQRDAPQDVALGHPDLVEPEGAERLEQDRRRRRRSSARGRGAGRAPRGARSRAARPGGRACAGSVVARQHVALDARRRRRLELEVDRRERRRGAGDGDRAGDGARARSAGTAASIDARARRRPAPRARRRVGGSVCEVALGVAHDADLGRDVEARPRRRGRRRARSSRRRCRSRPARCVAVGARARSRRGRSAAPPRRPTSVARLEPVARRAPRPRTRRRWRRRARREVITAVRALGAVRARSTRAYSLERGEARAAAASSPSAPVASTPSPSRVTIERRSSSRQRRRRRRRRRAGASSWCRCRRRRRACGGTLRPSPGAASARPSSAGQQVVDARSRHRARACATVAEPMCGTTSRLGASSSGWSAGSGSGSVTSSAAPAISPVVQRGARARPGRRRRRARC